MTEGLVIHNCAGETTLWLGSRISTSYPLEELEGASVTESSTLISIAALILAFLYRKPLIVSDSHVSTAIRWPGNKYLRSLYLSFTSSIGTAIAVPASRSRPNWPWHCLDSSAPAGHYLNSSFVLSIAGTSVSNLCLLNICENFLWTSLTASRTR